MKLLLLRFGKLFSMVEASKLEFFFITLMVFALSGLELLSLAFIGLYLGFIVDPASIIERISIFLPDLATNIQANINLSNQYIIFGIGLITTFFVKLIFVMFANFYISILILKQTCLQKQEKPPRQPRWVFVPRAPSKSAQKFTSTSLRH